MKVRCQGRVAVVLGGTFLSIIRDLTILPIKGVVAALLQVLLFPGLLTIVKIMQWGPVTGSTFIKSAT